MKNITATEIVDEIVRNGQGTRFATLLTETDARLKKTGNTFGQINKLSHINVAIGFDYTASVNRQQVREGGEGDFEAQAAKWGEMVQGCRWLRRNTKTNELYLVVNVLKVLDNPQYIKAISRQLVAKDDIRHLLPAKHSNAAHQGVEKEIIYRAYKLASIKEMHIGGEVYVISPDPINAAVTAEVAAEQEVAVPQE